MGVCVHIFDAKAPIYYIIFLSYVYINISLMQKYPTFLT